MLLLCIDFDTLHTVIDASQRITWMWNETCLFFAEPISAPSDSI